MEEKKKTEISGLSNRKWCKSRRSDTEDDGSNDEVQVRSLKMEPNWTVTKLSQAQNEDPDIKPVLESLNKSEIKPPPNELSPLSKVSKVYFSQWNRLKIRDGVLCRKWESEDGKFYRWQIILPRVLQKMVLQQLHSSNTSAHLGIAKTSHKISQRYYWHGQSADIRAWCRYCDVCEARKLPAKPAKAPLQQHLVGAPMERIAMDILGPFPETHRGNKVILVVADYFTKWVEAFALPNQEAETIATVLIEEFISRFGVPVELHTDLGVSFECRLFREVCTLLGIRKTRCSVANPKI